MISVSNKILALGSLLMVLLGCGREPGLLEGLPEGSALSGTTEISIANLKSMYTAFPLIIRTKCHIRGRVISSDFTNNVYKSLILEDISGTLEIKIDSVGYSDTFRCGSTALVACQDLVLGRYGNVEQLGVASSNSIYETDHIPAFEIYNRCRIEKGSYEEPEPVVITLAELYSERETGSLVNRYVTIKDVQFIDEELYKSWSDLTEDMNRTLIDREGNTLSVRTRKEAAFALVELPRGSGDISGILSFYYGTPQLKVMFPNRNSMRGPRF